MVLVTWRHVSRVTRHVPPRKKYAKHGPTGAYRRIRPKDLKLSGFVRNGMAHLPCK